MLEPVLAGPPSPDVAVPGAVRALAGSDPLRAVWANQVGGLTFEVHGERRRFVKWAPATSGVDLGSEARRLRWAAAYFAVPEVLDCGGDAHGTWLVTAPVPGDSAVSDRWKRAPEVAVTAMGEALRAFHDALPVARCPFSWSLADRLADVRRRAPAGRTEEAVARLADAPPIDRLVVCHGDACAPNTLLAPDGRWSGLVDLGAMGVADRWADLAVGSWSTRWNYRPGLEDRLFAAYGVEPDPVRIAYYRLLWDLGP